MRPQHTLSCCLSILIFCAYLTSSLAASIASATQIQKTSNHCQSKNKDQFIDFHCTSLQNAGALKAVIANLTENVLILEVSQLNWETFPLSLFQNVSLHTLIVGNSSFRALQNSSTAENSVQFLHHLSLENVTLHERPDWEYFADLENLQVLSIYNTTLRNDITSSFGIHLSKTVVSVTIAESNVTDISDDSFSDMENLSYLRISHNKLTNFPRLTFKNGSKLEQLRLDYNRIHSLPPGVFDNLPNLKVLSLSNNTISTLREEVFSPLWKSNVHVELRDNPIKCDCRILWTILSAAKPKDIIGQCAHPKHLYGKNLKDLKEEDLNC